MARRRLAPTAVDIAQDRCESSVPRTLACDAHSDDAMNITVHGENVAVRNRDKAPPTRPHDSSARESIRFAFFKDGRLPHRVSA
jgi:hypothetical protein